jgi:hypothetical protein
VIDRPIEHCELGLNAGHWVSSIRYDRVVHLVVGEYSTLRYARGKLTKGNRINSCAFALKPRSHFPSIRT